MPALALRAHFDGKHIILDEPAQLPLNATLLVTVLPDFDSADDSDEGWNRAASSNEAFAFLADPREDIYSLNDGEPFNDAV
jgi:hypothetical protein